MRSERGAPELGIQVFEDPDLVVIRLVGEFDLASSEQVESVLRECERKARTTVLVDLEELSFIDSTGLRVLLEAKRRAEDEGLVLRVTGSHGPVAKVLKLTGIESELALESRRPNGRGRGSTVSGEQE